MTGARVRCIGSDPRRAHGLAPVLVLADEPAQWPESHGRADGGGPAHGGGETTTLPLRGAWDAARGSRNIGLARCPGRCSADYAQLPCSRAG